MAGTSSPVKWWSLALATMWGERIPWNFCHWQYQLHLWAGRMHARPADSIKESKLHSFWPCEGLGITTWSYVRVYHCRALLYIPRKIWIPFETFDNNESKLASIIWHVSHETLGSKLLPHVFRIERMVGISKGIHACGSQTRNWKLTTCVEDKITASDPDIYHANPVILEVALSIVSGQTWINLFEAAYVQVAPVSRKQNLCPPPRGH